MIQLTIGGIISAVGWIFLVAFAGADPGYGIEVINLHSVAIANNVILLGYAVALWGILDLGFEKLAFSREAGKSNSGPQSAKSGAKSVSKKSQVSSAELDRLSLVTPNTEDADSIALWQSSADDEECCDELQERMSKRQSSLNKKKR